MQRMLLQQGEEELTVSNPWNGDIKVVYWPKNMYRSRWFRGVMGTVSDTIKAIDERGRPTKWDWCIEVFIGTIWEHSKGDFDRFVKELFRVWLEEWLHMIYRWERVNHKRFCEEGDPFHFDDEEKPVRKWVQTLTE